MTVPKKKNYIFFVIGCNGQDGSYIVEKLVSLGFDVVGLGRSPIPSSNIESQHFTYIPGDANNQNTIDTILKKYSPKRIIHAAAIHGSSGFDYESKWKELIELNLGVISTLMEYSRRVTDSHVTYLSSSKTLDFHDGEINEQTKRKSSCPYSIIKNASTDIINYYRNRWQISASVLWLFNHESSRRSVNYFLPKLASAIANSTKSKDYRCDFTAFDFFADWSCADYISEAIVNSSYKGFNEDFVLASGQTWHAANLAFLAFQEFGLDVYEHTNLNKVEISSYQSMPWYVNTSKAEKYLDFKNCPDALSTCIKIARDFILIPQDNSIK